MTDERTTAFEKMRKDLDGVTAGLHNQRILMDQAAIAFSALQLISSGEPGAMVTAQEALRRIVAKLAELQSPDTAS